MHCFNFRNFLCKDKTLQEPTHQFNVVLLPSLRKRVADEKCIDGCVVFGIGIQHTLYTTV
jgi:hypothetical protein